MKKLLFHSVQNEDFTFKLIFAFLMLELKR